MQFPQRYTEPWDELRHVIPAEQYARLGLVGSPFQAPSRAELLRLKMCAAAVRLAEKLVGAPLYAENQYRELATFEPRARNLLLKLIRDGLVANWRLGQATHDLPYVASCNLTLGEITLPTGKRVRMSGSTGCGVGRTASEALLPALGELLERHSTTQWREEEIVRGTYEALRADGAIDPKGLSFYSQSQLAREEFATSRVRHDALLGWVRAQSLLEKKSVLVPAQMAYAFYDDVHPREAQFWQTSSNGAAAGKTPSDAATRAILEAVERDAFMIFWQNRLTPRKVRLETVPDAEVARLVDECKRYRLELHLLDCTTDLGLPTFASVMIDRHGGPPITVSAACDLDPLAAVRKVTWEAVKFMRTPPETPYRTPAPKQIRTIEERRQFLCAAGHEYTAFLLSGEERSYQETVAQYPIDTNGEHLDALAHLLGEKGYPCYLVDLTSPVAREAELSVVRAIIPDLVPIHFREAKPHLGVRRLYEVPQRIGYRGALDESELNPAPHPFL